MNYNGETFVLCLLTRSNLVNFLSSLHYVMDKSPPQATERFRLNLSEHTERRCLSSQKHQWDVDL